MIPNRKKYNELVYHLTETIKIVKELSITDLEIIEEQVKMTSSKDKIDGLIK